jgi:hypothetical protein
MKFLKEYPAEFEKVIKLTYRREFNREAHSKEVSDWRSWGVRPYFAIIQEHQKNAKAGMFAQPNQAAKRINQSNQSGIQIQISLKVAGEVQSLASRVISNDGASVIANDGASIISKDGASFVATNSGTLMSVGGGRVIGSSLIGQAGGN